MKIFKKLHILNYGLFDFLHWPLSPLLDFFHFLGQFLIRMLPLLQLCYNSHPYKGLMSFVWSGLLVSVSHIPNLIPQIGHEVGKKSVLDGWHGWVHKPIFVLA